MSGHLPALAGLKNLIGKADGMADGMAGELAQRGLAMFAPGYIVRSDGLPVDETLADLRRAFDEKVRAGDAPAAQQIYALASRTASISDLTEDLYARFAANPASIANWFPALEQAVTESGSSFRLPATSIMRLSPELAQYLRLEYTGTNDLSRKLFDQLVFDGLGLERGRTYFLKTGTFSSKFEFANARCTEPEEAGQYFQVINNAAMVLGAGDTVDLCAREYIEPEVGTPTIYHGMPLRTELRAFVDLGDPVPQTTSLAQSLGLTVRAATREPALLGITPYWHPSVMVRALALAERQPGMDHIRGDYDTYLAAQNSLVAGFDAHRDGVAANLTALIEPLRAAGLSGAWSIDVMVDRGDQWLIDAAPMRTSALTEQLLVTDEYSLADPKRIEQLAGELIVDQFDPRMAGMTPGFDGPTHRYRWDAQLTD